MDRKIFWIMEAAVAAVVLGVLGARGFLSAQTPPPILRYQTNCTINEARDVDGYVVNLSGDMYQVSGPVRFSFYSANTMTHPEVLLAANAFIPAGATVRVARAQVLFRASPGETCSFDVTQSIGKL